MTTCFECGREISELAASCPHCGAPGRAAGGSGLGSAPEGGSAPGSGLGSGPEATGSGPGSQPEATDARGFGSMEGRSRPGLVDRLNARKIIYVGAGVTLVVAMIKPALVTAAIFAAIAYWTANQTLRPGGSAAESAKGSLPRQAHDLWQGLGVIGRVAASAAIGLVLALFMGVL